MGRKLEPGHNDLATTHPELVAEWDYERNAPRTPNEVLSGSNQKVFWLCPKGHSYYKTPNERSSGKACAVCAGKAVLAGFNDLATTHPDLAREWDYERNAPLTPEQVSFGSHKKVFWLCPEGHSYESSVANHVLGRGCAFCSGKAVLAGFNDFSSRFPELVAEWDYERNAPLTPEQVSFGSGKKVFWLCPQGHSFSATVDNRRAGKSCAICAGHKVLAGFNDLATTHPELVAEWDYERNAPLTPEQVSFGTQRKIFWLCPEGHSYKTSLASRSSNETGCSVCAGRTVQVGFNDLATTHPDLAREWDYERNAPLTPEHVSYGSQKIVFWLCPEGHSYQSTTGARKRGQGCAVCAGKAVLAGFNDLATTHPELVAEWDYERNAPLTPEHVSYGSNRKIYWLCPEGHSYNAAPSGRVRGRDCPSCANYGYDPAQPGLLYFLRSTALQARKIGITNPDRKSKRLEKYGPEWVVISTVRNDSGQLIREVEATVLKWIRQDWGLMAYLGKADMGQAGGHTETFSMEGPSDYEVLQKIEQTLEEHILGVKNRRKIR